MRVGNVLALCTAAAAMLSAPAVFLAQTQQAAIEPRSKADDTPRPDVRIDTSIVLIPVSVTDSLGRPVAGLDKEHFRIRDNKVDQQIKTFSMDDGPVAMGLVFDTSSSMAGMISVARRAAALFVSMANPGDQFLLVEFDDKPRMTVPLTSDLAHIRYELTFNRADGNTALIDGVYMAMHEIKKSPNERKALIVVSDGGDNHSRYSQGELKTLMQESEVLIYSVAISTQDAAPYLMKHIAEDSGGRMFVTNAQLPDIATKISVDLRNRYVLGYVPTNSARDGLYHKVDVEVKAPKGFSKLNLHWRRGYYAPSQ
jgi:VWFA-related protein